MSASPLHIITPLVDSRPLSLCSNRLVRLKLEALQPSGSFKLRGIGHACQTYLNQGAKRFVSSSGGNAGVAVAYAGYRLGVPVTVVVPVTTTKRAQENITQLGAQLIVHGDSWQEANTRAQAMVCSTDAFIHPFDDPLLWQGHATLVEEVVQTGFKPEAIVLAVGGGGLLAGVIEGLQRHGWEDVPVVAVETAGADSLSQSVAAGQRIRLDAITSIATSLGAKEICARAFALLREHPIISHVVTDQSAVAACWRFLDDQRLLVEPACGAALAPVYENHQVLDPYRSLLVIVCGGVTTSATQLCLWSHHFTVSGQASPLPLHLM